VSYRAIRNWIVNIETGQQVAVVVPANCTMREASQMAAFCAEQMTDALCADESASDLPMTIRPSAAVSEAGELAVPVNELRLVLAGAHHGEH